MSAYNPETYLEASYCGATVYSMWRADNELVCCGNMYAFVWDTDNNGCIVEFREPNWLVRYFVSWKQLEDNWTKEKGFELPTDITFVEIIPNVEYKELKKVRQVGSIVRKRKRIPIWGQLIEGR